MEISEFLSNVTYVFSFIFTEFTSVTGMIMNNTILFVPVLLALFGGVLTFCVVLLKKFGIRGIASSGRRRRR